MKILGVRIDNLSKAEILEKVNGFLSENKFHQIATVNPEFILAAQKNQHFKNILNECDLSAADGVGIRFAGLRFGKFLKARIAGIDLMEEILRIAECNNYGVFLAANKDGLSKWEEMRDAILRKYPKLNIDGVNLAKKNTDFRLPVADYSIVFCNFGAPNQEKFLASLKGLKDSKIRLGMGVGGSFDYLTGKIRRAPVFMRKIGVEWIWRLIQQPKRLKRIFNAVIIFPIKVIFNK